MNQQKLDIYHQFFHIKSKITQVTEYKLDQLFDYHLEDKTTESIENDYNGKFGGDHLIAYQAEFHHNIYYTKSNVQVKNIKTPQDIIHFIENEMNPWLEQNT